MFDLWDYDGVGVFSGAIGKLNHMMRVSALALEHDARGELLLLVPKLGRLCN